jgi:hypothetical protein
LDGGIADLALHEVYGGIGESEGFLSGGEGARILAIGAGGSKEGKNNGRKENQKSQGNQESGSRAL